MPISTSSSKVSPLRRVSTKTSHDERKKIYKHITINVHLDKKKKKEKKQSSKERKSNTTEEGVPGSLRFCEMIPNGVT